MSSPSKENLPKVADEIQQELFSFKASNLKHAETQEKVTLPSKEDIESEKEHKQMIEGIETFDPSKLKHAETLEKNPLPTKEDGIDSR
uniref:Putative ciboulot n=1 Tax=Ixodes ricinus TaxID=34613 RepID=A0A0K8RJY2_IXORI